MGRYYLDLFSGIGGFALGAQWAGVEFDGHYFSEIEKYAVEVYQKRFPEAVALGDIRNVNYRKLPEGEYFATAGFPCQPHSVAGKRKASKDERDLWPECVRMLRELRPRIALFENVPGLFISDGGRFFNRILSDISAGGYDAEWKTISASRIGAPHIRNRVWIVCYPNDAGGGGDHYWRTPDANMERGNRSVENMKMRIETGKPLNLNDQLNAISKGLLPVPMIGTPTRGMCRRSLEFAKGRIPNPMEYVQMFPTPTTQEVKHSEIELTDNGRRKPKKGKTSHSLNLVADTVQMFPTPRANSGTGKCVHGEGGLDLQTAVKLWPPPRAGNPGSRPNRKGGKILSEEVKKTLFPTPTTQDYKHRGPNSNQQGLADVVRLWATPTANDAKNSLTDSQAGRGTLTAHIVETEDVKSGQLNADWVEVLMGYPQGWTDLEKDTLIIMDLPAAWLDGTWEYGIPRIITGQKNRVKRLKGLGNSVVPLIPMIIWLLIKEYL